MNPEITIYAIEHFNDRYYKVKIKPNNEDYVPSVTTKLNIIAKPFLAQWRGNLGNREADLKVWEAQERGKRIHAAWHTFVMGGIVVYQPFNSPKYSEEQIKAIKIQTNGNYQVLRYQEEMIQLHKLQLIHQKLKPKNLGSEMIVYDLDNQDAGTIDNIFDIKEGTYSLGSSKPLILPKGIWICDVKSGNQVDSHVWRQIAPYAKMYEKMTKKSVTGGLIFHSNAKTKTGYNVLSRLAPELEQDYLDYRKISDLWVRDHGDKKPKYIEFPSLISMNKGAN